MLRRTLSSVFSWMCQNMEYLKTNVLQFCQGLFLRCVSCAVPKQISFWSAAPLEYTARSRSALLHFQTCESAGKLAKYNTSCSLLWRPGAMKTIADGWNDFLQLSLYTCQQLIWTLSKEYNGPTWYLHWIGDLSGCLTDCLSWSLSMCLSSFLSFDFSLFLTTFLKEWFIQI